jgi:hypothetical protein
MSESRKRQPSKGDQLRRQGFDLTAYDRMWGTYRARCSQCQATVINGTASHERGCPNIKKERE